MGLDHELDGNGVGGEGEVYKFKAASHAGSLLASVHNLRERNGLCDVTLRAEDGREIQAHKVILAAGSPYFNAMFSNAHRESVASSVDLKGISGETLQPLVGFIYTSSLEITENNVQSLLSGASHLQLPSVVRACGQFLKDRVCSENCLGIAAFGDRYGCPELHRFAWMFAVENFPEVVRGEEFLTIPAPLLTEWAKCEELRVSCEEEVLDSVLLWLKHDEKRRSSVVMAALEHIKLPLVPWKSLQDKFNSFQTLSSDSRCEKFVEGAKSHQTCNTSPKPHSEIFTLVQYIPRQSIGQNMFIYAVGGEMSPGRTTTASIELFEPAKNVWQKLAAMTTCRRGVGVAMLNGYLYAVGGSDGFQPLKLAERYDPKSDDWTRVSDMNEPRSSVAAATLGEYFYAIGGYTGVTSCLQSVEQYNPSTDTWTYISNMIVPRSMACACSMGGRMYVVGGYNGVSDLQSCEVYNQEKGTWELIEEMKTRRCMAGVAAIDDDHLYVAGGCDHSVCLRSVESYDSSTGKWSVLNEMAEARSGLGLATIGRKLFAVGGHNGRGGNSGYCVSVEQYHPETNTWTAITDMTAGRRRFGCCS